MAEMNKLEGVEPMAVKGCERLVVDVVKNQNKKFADITSDYSTRSPFIGFVTELMGKICASIFMMSDFMILALLVA